MLQDFLKKEDNLNVFLAENSFSLFKIYFSQNCSSIIKAFRKNAFLGFSSAKGQPQTASLQIFWSLYWAKKRIELLGNSISFMLSTSRACKAVHVLYTLQYAQYWLWCIWLYRWICLHRYSSLSMSGEKDHLPLSCIYEILPN